MANIVKRVGKSGTVSYLIRVSAGYDAAGRQIKKSMTWVVPDGMTEKKAEKELQRQIVKFDERVSAGTSQDDSIRFSTFADKWYSEFATKQLKIKTYCEYKKRLIRINAGIGHIKLRDLKTGHLNAFYANLQEDGMNLHTGGKLSASSVRTYHRVVSSVLSKAVKWGYIPYNPAINAELPKMGNHEAAHLDELDARRLLVLLQDEPIKYRTMITFDLLSGLRRGELLGLRWGDIDFANETISIKQTSSYMAGVGVYVDTPKNETSSRPLKLSRSAFILLGQYKDWQDGQKEACGDLWKDTEGRIFTTEEGVPVHPDTITKWFTKFVQRTGLPKVTVHSLRHTYASLMIADGTPLVVVSKRLGHAQVSTTANIYSHVIASADERAAQITDKFDDIILIEAPRNARNA